MIGDTVGGKFAEIVSSEVESAEMGSAEFGEMEGWRLEDDWFMGVNDEEFDNRGLIA